VIDREGTVAHLNRMLDDQAAGRRTRTNVVLRLVMILPCVDRRRAHQIIDSGARFAVVDNRITEVYR